MPTISSDIDQGLLERLSKGDNEAFAILFSRHSDKLYSAALVISKSTAVAEDVVQDIFLKLWEHRHQYAGIADLGDFLFVAMRNTIFKKFRHTKVTNAYENFQLHMMNTLPVRPESFSEVRELEELINLGVSQLSPQQQRAFRLSREQGLDHASIATEMNISRATAKDYIVRALAFLRKHLQDNGVYRIIALSCVLFQKYF